MTVTLIKYPTPLLNKIGSYVCQAIIYIQQQQPELLLDKYRSISWRENNNQSRLKAKLIELIANIQDWESLVKQVEVFIQTFLISDSSNTPVLIKLQEKIRHLNPNISELQPSNNKQDIKSAPQEPSPETTEEKANINQQEIDSNESNQKELLSPENQLQASENEQEINYVTKKIDEQTALLLDAENFQFTADIEQFLTNLFVNPIQIKIAFANWQSMGKKDIDFHNRGYDLIHVPRGKNNADGKMIAFGSIIDEYYPKVKEVLVCSSDNVMNKLCSNLQQKGLTVYQVSQELSNLTILNGKTKETQNHTILPSIEKLLCQIKEIIEEQEQQTLNQWIKLSKICKLFKDKYSFGVNKVVDHHFPGKNVKNIFVDKPEFVIHQIPEHPEVYVTLFKMPIQQDDVAQKISILTFDNKSQLEKALIEIITILVGKAPENYIPIYTVCQRFEKKHGKGITKILKELNMSGNLINFLQSCNSFELKKTGSIWQVAVKSQ